MRAAATFAMLALCAAAPASSERKAVLDALRSSVETKVGPNVEFVVQVLRVENGWAFVMADPQRKVGSRSTATATSTISTIWTGFAWTRCFN